MNKTYSMISTDIYDNVCSTTQKWKMAILLGDLIF